MGRDPQSKTTVVVNKETRKWPDVTQDKVYRMQTTKTTRATRAAWDITRNRWTNYRNIYTYYKDVYVVEKDVRNFLCTCIGKAGGLV